MTTECPKCHTPNPVTGEFCRQCGYSLDSARVGRATRGRNLAIAALLAVIVAVAAGYFVLRPTVSPEGAPTTPATPTPSSAKLKLGIAYGTEKREWLTWAAGEFAKSPQGQGIDIDLQGKGSLDAAHAIAAGDKSIQVWSPASALYKDTFVRDWGDRNHGANPIIKEAPLALTPMVFVMWNERYAAFKQKYAEVNFQTLAQALAEPGGWSTIAQQPDWSFFKFSHTHPNKSNSGLMTLLLMAYDFHGKHAGLEGRDLISTSFQQSVQGIEKNLVHPTGDLIDSTGTLMNSMIQRGPSTYDAIFVYESVAIDGLNQAKGRWSPLRVVYPRYNMWNDNPYYILDVPWSTPQHRQAAEAFLNFLLSERIQAEAMVHGFRPANTKVATNSPDSPFMKHQDAGIQPDVRGQFCEPPKADTIENLLLLWQRSQGTH